MNGLYTGTKAQATSLHSSSAMLAKFGNSIIVINYFCTIFTLVWVMTAIMSLLLSH